MEGSSETRPYHHGDLRRALLNAARDLIVEKGVSGTSLRQIACCAGVSVRAPYHHFPDKLSLLAEVAREGFERLAATMARRLQGIDDPARRVAELGIAYLEFAEAHPGDFQAMYWAELCDPQNFPDREEAAERPFQLLLDTLQQAATRQLPEDDLMRIALAAWSTVHGLAMLQAHRLLERIFPEAEAPTLSRDVVERATRSLLAELRR